MERYISVSDLLENINHELFLTESTRAAFKSIARKTKVADVAPVKRGKWLFDEETITPYCSECKRIHRSTEWKPNYCPNCGAVMDGEIMADEVTL